MPQAVPRRLYIPESVHVARTLLGELRSAHRALIGQLMAMEALTRKTAVDPTVCATARWKLGQASLSRRLLAARICDYFMPRLEPTARGELKALVTADQALLRDASAHLGCWTAAAIQADWPGFCSGWREMQRKSHDHIALEQRLLYPLLAGAAERL